LFPSFRNGLGRRDGGAVQEFVAEVAAQEDPANGAHRTPFPPQAWQVTQLWTIFVTGLPLTQTVCELLTVLPLFPEHEVQVRGWYG
jgi:hypothetical protein